MDAIAVERPQLGTSRPQLCRQVPPSRSRQQSRRAHYESAPITPRLGSIPGEERFAPRRAGTTQPAPTGLCLSWDGRLSVGALMLRPPQPDPVWGASRRRTPAPNHPIARLSGLVTQRLSGLLIPSPPAAPSGTPPDPRPRDRPRPAREALRSSARNPPRESKPTPAGAQPPRPSAPTRSHATRPTR